MSIAQAMDYLASSGFPEIARTTLPDRMNIERAIVATGSGGGQKKSGTQTRYEDVPCLYSPLNKAGDRKWTKAERLESSKHYTVVFPVIQAGQRVDIDPNLDTIRTLARDAEPEKVFRVITTPESNGVLFEAVCVKEG